VRGAGAATPRYPHRAPRPDPNALARFPDGSLPTSARAVRQEFARCNQCAGHRARAVAILARHPALAARIGGEVAADQMEAVLVALAVLGKPAPDPAALTT
jgi:hypothetical protein